MNLIFEVSTSNPSFCTEINIDFLQKVKNQSTLGSIIMVIIAENRFIELNSNSIPLGFVCTDSLGKA